MGVILMSDSFEKCKKRNLITIVFFSRFSYRIFSRLSLEFPFQFLIFSIISRISVSISQSVLETKIGMKFNQYKGSLFSGQMSRMY